MSSKTLSFDASASALGYLYQCRYALLLALQHDEDTSLQMSIEKLDDLAFLESDQAGSTPTELIQFKHHVKKAGSLTDKSLDIWKTLRIWSELILAKKVDVDHAVFVMLTTSLSGKMNAVHRLIDDTSVRDHNEALRLLEEAGKSSKDKDVRKAYLTLMCLNTHQRRKLFERVHLLERCPDILAVRKKLETAVRLVVRPQHVSAFIDRLEGWWFNVVIEHLMSSMPESIIAVTSVHQQVHDLREQFQRDALPDDFLEATIPSQVTPPDDQRMFIRQLNLVRVTKGRIKTAQEDHYRAFSQRSRWIRDNLVNLTEVEKFEARLHDEWKHKYEIVQESIPESPEESHLSEAGKKLYNWTQEHAPANATLFIRPQFPSSYMVRGSYHMLADKLRVGWHPHYDVRLASSEIESKGDK